MLQVAATIAYALVTLGFFLRDATSPTPGPNAATIICSVLALSTILGAFGLRGKTLESLESKCQAALPWLVGLLTIAFCNVFTLRGVGQLLQQSYWLGSLLVLFGVLPFIHFLVPRVSRYTFLITITIVLFVGLSATTTLANKPAGLVPFAHLQQASASLLNGSNPYDEIYAETLNGDSNGEQSIQLNPLKQLPAVILSVLPSFYAMSDTRWTMLCALIASVFLLRSMISCTERPSSKYQSIASWLPLMMLYHPQTESVLRAGHQEPLFALAIIATFWAVVKSNAIGKTIGLAGILSTSCLGPLCMPPFMLLSRIQARTLVLVIALACIPSVPFLLWNRSALLAGIDLPPNSLVAFSVAVLLGASLAIYRRRTNATKRPTDVPLVVAAVLICFQLLTGSFGRSMGWTVCASLLAFLHTKLGTCE